MRERLRAAAHALSATAMPPTRRRRRRRPRCCARLLQMHSLRGSEACRALRARLRPAASDMDLARSSPSTASASARCAEHALDAGQPLAPPELVTNDARAARARSRWTCGASASRDAARRRRRCARVVGVARRPGRRAGATCWRRSRCCRGAGSTPPRDPRPRWMPRARSPRSFRGTATRRTTCWRCAASAARRSAAPRTRREHSPALWALAAHWRADARARRRSGRRKLDELHGRRCATAAPTRAQAATPIAAVRCHRRLARCATTRCAVARSAATCVRARLRAAGARAPGRAQARARRARLRRPDRRARRRCAGPERRARWRSGCARSTALALVDEFQDTDARQWAIFRRMFAQRATTTAARAVPGRRSEAGDLPLPRRRRAHLSAARAHGRARAPPLRPQLPLATARAARGRAHCSQRRAGDGSVRVGDGHRLRAGRSRAASAATMRCCSTARAAPALVVLRDCRRPTTARTRTRRDAASAAPRCVRARSAPAAAGAATGRAARRDGTRCGR